MEMNKNIYGAAPPMISELEVIERALERWLPHNSHLVVKVVKMLKPRPCWLIIQEYTAVTPSWWGNDSRLDAAIMYHQNGHEVYWAHETNDYYVEERHEISRTPCQTIYEALEKRRLWAESEDKYWPICECDHCQNQSTSWLINTLLDPSWGLAEPDELPF